MGRSGSLGGLGHITLGDLARGLGRYRPAALAAAAVVLTAWVLPDRVPDGGDPQSATASAPDVASGLSPSPSPAIVGTPDLVEALVPSLPSSSFFDAPSPPFGAGPTPSPGAGAPESRSPAAGGDTAPAADAPGEGLSVRGSGWASQNGNTPVVGGSSVPNGTLPVSRLLGETEKASFVRLSGTGAMLVLAEDPRGARGPVGGQALVQACRITDPGWQETEGGSLAAAPRFDSQRCAIGRRGDGGTFSFDLSAFPERADNAGFALVPAPGGAIDFQVTFRR